MLCMGTGLECFRADNSFARTEIVTTITRRVPTVSCQSLSSKMILHKTNVCWRLISVTGLRRRTSGSGFSRTAATWSSSAQSVKKMKRPSSHARVFCPWVQGVSSALNRGLLAAKGRCVPSGDTRRCLPSGGHVADIEKEIEIAITIAGYRGYARMWYASECMHLESVCFSSRQLNRFVASLLIVIYFVFFCGVSIISSMRQSIMI